MTTAALENAPEAATRAIPCLFTNYLIIDLYIFYLLNFCEKKYLIKMEMAQSTSVTEDIYSQRVTTQKYSVTNLKVHYKLKEKSLIVTEKMEPMEISVSPTYISQSETIGKPLSIMKNI